MIKDFGDRIDGAAKDRWSGFRSRLVQVADMDVADRPLSETFPEPNCKALLKDGVDPLTLSFVRALRDTIPPKPRNRRISIWVSQVTSVRDICFALLNDDKTADILREDMANITRFNDSLKGRVEMYQRFGHDRSFKDLKIGSDQYSRVGEERFDPPKRFWSVKNMKMRLNLMSETLDDLMEDLGKFLDRQVEPEKKTREVKLKLFSFRSKPGVHICRKFGKNTVSIASFPDVKLASAALKDGYDEYVRISEVMRQMPEVRSEGNRVRTGVDRRNGADVTPEIFTEAFGFRGVQFGNYVEKDRRQQDLNNAYDAFMDLADVLGCAPSALSLDGRLALAFGARGRGGVDPAAAHYEPREVVINLTKKQGAGSLAHEWFHGLDNAIGRKSGRIENYGSCMGVEECKRLMPDDRREIGAMSSLTTKIIARTDILKRAGRIDEFRATPYWATRHEISARCFEAWVIDALDKKHGAKNDYLANIVSEGVFAAEAALMGIPEDKNRYPYPTSGEIASVSELFASTFREDGPVASLLTPLAGDRPAPVFADTPEVEVETPIVTMEPVKKAVQASPQNEPDEDWNMDGVEF